MKQLNVVTKKIVSIFLLVGLLLTFATPAFAEDGPIVSPKPDQSPLSAIVKDTPNSSDSYGEEYLILDYQLTVEELQKLYSIWNLAVRYRLENVADTDYSFENDPKMHKIWALRGTDLRYFLDFAEALNIARSETFGPSLNTDIPMTLEREQKIVASVSSDVFGFAADNVIQGENAKLNGLEVTYATKLRKILLSILTRNENQYFTAEYLKYRSAVIHYVDETNARIFGPSTDEDVIAFSKYLNKEHLNYANGPKLSLAATDTCITRTNNNWPTKGWATPSNSGSSWYYGNNPDDSDCDIYVKYYTGGSTWGHLHATTSDGQCVLNKFDQFAAYMSGNFNHVQYGKVRVTWRWPIGCDTTEYAVMVGTRLGP